MHIRPETPGDAPAIAALNREAFGGPYEAGLIDRLRASNLLAVSLVGIESGLIVGHILFSELGVELEGRPVRAVALAPMCVRADRQRRGLGSALVRAGLQAVREAGYAAVIVLGHPEFYPRFGFSPDLAEKLESPFRGSAFMALELVAGALRGGRGKVTYPSAFDPA
ncbi:MAG TPA: N-acetyltransferase [Aestuariivirgaceae bacterium]|nr:N-acetyltransferase [Aestuariivirgaceae bacterium]